MTPQYVGIKQKAEINQIPAFAIQYSNSSYFYFINPYSHRGIALTGPCIIDSPSTQAPAKHQVLFIVKIM
jgi:hypothetical protein